MCGRYAASRRPDALIEEFEVESPTETVIPPDYNVAPTKQVYVVLQRGDDGAQGSRRLEVARWGLVPSWAKDPAIGSRMINARIETAAEKPSFRRAFARRRCLVPADGYYEWYTPPDGPLTAKGRPQKQPFFIRPSDGSSLAMAGLYEWWRPSEASDDWLLTMTILTTTASDALRRIHDRMPLVVEREAWAAWLDPSVHDPLGDLIVAASPDRLEAYPVSTAVNSVRNNGPQLLEPLKPEDAEGPLEVGP